jgi:hypothetical protein
MMQFSIILSIIKKISRLHCLKDKVTSLGHHWQYNGVFKTILLIWDIRLRHFLAETSETLCILYAKGKLWKTS